MEELLQHIIHVANSNSLNITPLQLNLVSYFTLGFLIKNKDTQLVQELYKEEKFIARPNGPSLNSVREKYSLQSGLPILEEGRVSHRLSEVHQLNDVVKRLINRDVFDLVGVSQRQHYWQYNRVYILSRVHVYYDLETLESTFLEG